MNIGDPKKNQSK